MLKFTLPPIFERVEKYLCTQSLPEEPKEFPDWGKVAEAYPTTEQATFMSKVSVLIFLIIAVAIWWFL